MKVDMHINGSLTIELTPGTDIEKLVLKEMSEAAEKGRSVVMKKMTADSVVISVEK